MNISIKRFGNGMTITDLKALLATWPERRSDGSPTEVWVGDHNGTSNQVRAVVPLDLREDVPGTAEADILLDVKAR